MKIVFVTRYSFFGYSGWQSPDSKAKERLFDPKRLAQRSECFEKVMLASLQSQTDAKYQLLVLSSEDLPEEHKVLLQEMCHDTVGDRAHILFRPLGHAGTQVRHYIRSQMKGPRYTAQVVLDDDDAVSNDFVETVRTEAQHLIPYLRSSPEYDYSYLSFPEGLSAVFGDNQIDLYKRSVPFTNLGLTLLAPTMSRRNPFNIDHAHLQRDHPSRLIYMRKPYYIRSVHGYNDSNAGVGDIRWPEDDLETSVYPRFPFLKDLVLSYRQEKQARAA